MQIDNSNLADSTIFHEFLIYYKRFNEMLNKNLKLSQITNVSATSYRAYTRRLDLEPDTIKDVDCVTNAFLTCKNEFGITTGKDKYINHYEIEEFRILATKKVFKKVFEKINNKELNIIRYRKTMTTLTYENTSKRYDKSKQKQIDRYLNKKDNELSNNCFHIACCLLIPKIFRNVHRDDFKHSSIAKQLEKVKEILGEHNLSLKLEVTIFGVIGNVIQDIKGKAMIIFYLDNDICHAEAIIDGEVMDKKGSCIWKYELLMANVKIYRFNSEVDDDETYFEINNIDAGDDSDN